MSFHVPEQYRLAYHPLFGTMDASWGNNGAFRLRNTGTGRILHIIASDGDGWERVSVSVSASNQTPAWADMCHVKELFWDAEDVVMQLHPPESTYINNHAGCLHLWRPLGQSIPLPPIYLVGKPGLTPKELEAMSIEELRAIKAEALEKYEAQRPAQEVAG